MGTPITLHNERTHSEGGDRAKQHLATVRQIDAFITLKTQFEY